MYCNSLRIKVLSSCFFVLFKLKLTICGYEIQRYSKGYRQSMEASFKVVISNDPKAILLIDFFLLPVTI